jgi:hypothetical protein
LLWQKKSNVKRQITAAISAVISSYK